MRTYEALANAIIIQAAEDYKQAATILHNNPKNIFAAGTVESLLAFFYSQWFEALTAVDSKKLVKKLNKELERGVGYAKKTKYTL